MFVVDVNTYFGKSAGNRLDHSLGRLVAALDGGQTGLAFTYSLRGVRYLDSEGNDETLEAASDHPGLLPAATLDLRRYLGWEEEVDRCLTAGVRLFRLFPEVQGWSVSDSPFGALVSKLAGTGAVVMLSIGGAAGPSPTATSVGQATAAQGVPAILVDVSYSNMSEVIAAMQRFPNLYAETDWMSIPGGIEVMAGEVGAGRVLYGSGAPLYPVSRALNHVFESGVSAEEKEQVLGRNAVRLFGLDAGQMAGRPQVDDNGILGFSEPVIDIHCHLGRWEFPIPAERGADLMRLMKQAGIERSISSSAEAIIYDLARGNRWLAEEIEGHPELLGYVTVNPNYLELSCEEMDRYYRQPNFVGAKLHCDYSASPTASARTRRLLEEVARRGKPLKIHTSGGGTAQALKDAALAHPDWAIIKAHGGGKELALELADAPNIYFEFAGSRCSSQNILGALEVLGEDRLMFGSDATLLSICSVLGAYRDANLTAEQRRKVLSGNARRVFKL